MSFISYAQNFEDVMLWRALKHVECGFYIDVGANDPEIDSVTKAFYDHGWRGINIEPVAQWFQRLEEKRPRDINLQIAAGAHQGELVIYEFPDTGLSTIDKATAERHETERGYTKLEQVVPVETLTSICQRFHLAPIHFLKIDVEGAEKDVLEGLDLSIIRPWIIVVESTLPMTQIEDYAQWEAILRGANYDYVYFDGLNRYYIPDEHAELKAHFHAPPNVFDGFVLSGIASQPFCKLVESKAQEQEQRALAAEAESRALAAETRAQEQEQRALAAETHHAAQAQRIDELGGNSHHWWQQACALEMERNALRQSWSWRSTTPLRWGGSLVIHGVPGIRQGATHFVHSAIQAFRHPLAAMMRVVLRNPSLSYRINQHLLRYPALHQQLLGVARSQGAMPGVSTYVPPCPPSAMAEMEALDHLAPRTRQIYSDLKAAIENRQKENG